VRADVTDYGGEYAKALGVFALGFLVEAGTEAYQLAGLGTPGRFAVGLYYASLGTTVFGFYIMYRADRLWRRLALPGTARMRRGGLPAIARLAFALLLSAIGFQLLSENLGGLTLVFAILVGAATVLAFLGFFERLYRIGAHGAGREARVLLAVALGWSIADATYAGVLLGSSSRTLLRELVVDFPAVFGTFAPVARAMAGLVVTYLLLAAVFLWRRQRAPPADSGDSGITGAAV
jgi:hypothetical protein